MTINFLVIDCDRLYVWWNYKKHITWFDIANLRKLYTSRGFGCVNLALGVNVYTWCEWACCDELASNLGWIVPPHAQCSQDSLQIFVYNIFRQRLHCTRSQFNKSRGKNNQSAKRLIPQQSFQALINSWIATCCRNWNGHKPLEWT